MTLHFTNDHEWLELDGLNAKIGITDYAQRQLGDVVYVDLPEVGRSFAAGEALGEIESTKSVGELFAPGAGTVTAVNDAVAADPTLVNAGAESEGWLIEVTFDAAPEGLLSADDYAALTA
ncbi:glycine cleavage system protein GcvH [Humidisolicoccus flavus]|uniref:glycine cleavage system protein GcvH n=1 Tax=Humidisolicoccus flavus TaxID=3111414 RepID=UPI00324DDAC0